VSVLHDIDEFTLTSSEPMPFQVDGDYLGERTSVTFRAHPAALHVVC
jgi:diacylglycerol kinase family enzyme